MTRDVWGSSGWHLLAASESGELAATPDFLRAYFNRFEVRPDETSGDAELALHAALMDDPLRRVGDAELDGLDDEDLIHNYRVVLGFRDLLVDSGSLEAAYLRLVRGESPIPLPKLFIDQIAHAILRQILNGVVDPMRFRAAELFFREQNVSTSDGRIMLADEETVDMYAETGGMGSIGKLLAESATPMRQVELDVLDDDNCDIYWARSDRFDTVVDFRFTQPALDAFARVIEAWVKHFHQMEVRVQPLQRIDDERWSWHIGLDAEATRILNELYNGEDAKLNEQAQLIALFSMEIKDRSSVIESVRGRPVYLGLAMTKDKKVRMKPQNLLVNLPLERPV